MDALTAAYDGDIQMIDSELSKPRNKLIGSAIGRFCCRSPLRHAANRDSILLTRISAGASHDGPTEERTNAAFLPV